MSHQQRVRQRVVDFERGVWLGYGPSAVPGYWLITLALLRTDERRACGPLIVDLSLN